MGYHVTTSRFSLREPCLELNQSHHGPRFHDPYAASRNAAILPPCQARPRSKPEELVSAWLPHLISLAHRAELFWTGESSCGNSLYLLGLALLRCHFGCFLKTGSKMFCLTSYTAENNAFPPNIEMDFGSVEFHASTTPLRCLMVDRVLSKSSWSLS